MTLLALFAAAALAMDVRLDDRLQALGLAEWLSGRTPQGFSAPPLPKPRVEAPPGPAAAFDFLSRTDSVMRLTDAFEPRLFVPDNFIQRAGGKGGFDAWRAGLRDMARQPEAAKWLAGRQAALKPIVEEYRRTVTAMDYQGRIEGYVGFRLNGRYSLQLSEFHATGSQINVVALEDGAYDIISLMGPSSWTATTPVYDPALLAPTAWHELAHGLTDELIDLYADLVKARAGRWKETGWDCYGGWNQCVREHVVRAVMIRLMHAHVSPEAAERELKEEEKKFPWLRAMTEALARYEARRRSYPGLGHFMPELLAVIPESASPPEPASPGRNWLDHSSFPFSPGARRKRALERLDSLLAVKDPRPDLLARRAGLLAVDGRCEAAAADASAALRKAPDTALALLARAHCAGQAQARLDLEAVERLCAKGAEEPGLCADAADRLARLRGGAADSSLFVVDPRVELLGVVFALARPKELEGPEAPYVKAALERFRPFQRHRAVKELESLIDKEGRLAPAMAMLRLSEPPELAHPQEEEERLPKAFVAAMRDFAVESRFMDFFEAERQRHAEWTRRAAREARVSLTSGEAAAYLRRPAPGLRFILTLLLPARYCVNHGEARMRWPERSQADELSFNFDEFGSSPGHETAHAIADRLALDRKEELEAYSGLMKPGCTDSWNGCILEHVDLAVTLRAVARRDEARSRALLDEYVGRGFVYLPALLDRLKEYEGSPGLSFEAFYPRLMDVFGDLLGEAAREQARRNLAARQARAPQPVPAPSPRLEQPLRVEPRVELLAALLLLSDGKTGGPYAALQRQALAGLEALRAHPAAALARKPWLPKLLASLGPPPDLAARDGLSDDELSAAGHLRDFARKADLPALMDRRQDLYLPLRTVPPAALRERAGQPRPNRGQVLALSPLLRPGTELRFESGAEDWFVASAADYAPAVEAGPEVSFEVDPRLELLSVLALLSRGKPWPEADPAYSRRALEWFGALSTHPAVALAGRHLSAGNGRLDLLASVALRLTPAFKLEEALPEGYAAQLGGERGVEDAVSKLADFAARGRLEEFLKASAADHERFRETARKEAAVSLSPRAAAAYLGRPFGDRYIFLLAGLLPQRYGANLALYKGGRLLEYRVRAASWRADTGVRFGFDHFGNSVAHELVHLVTNPLAAELDVKGRRPPAGCNDEQEPSWAVCAQEHLVYAVTMRVVAQERGEKAYEDLVRDYEPRGFPFLGPLGEELKRYERSRARYAALEDYWPRLSRVFLAGPQLKGPAEPSPLDPKARRLKDEGVKSFVAGKLAEAEKLFRQALSVAPADAEALLNLGVVAQARGRATEADGFYRRAAEAGLRSGGRGREVAATAWSSRASLMRAQGKRAAEKESLRRALDAAPSDWEAAPALRARLEELE